MLVDLHCHSTASDGEYAPERVAQEMAAAGVRYAALTDHNSTAGQAAFRDVLEQCGVVCITGVEMSIFSPEGPLHLLAYGFDPCEARLASALQVIRNPMGWFTRRWVGRLRARISGSPAPALSEGEAGLSGLRFTQGRLDFRDAAVLIHQAGGLAFLAHPLTRISAAQLDRLLHALPPLGLDGIEVFYQPYSPVTCRKLLELAEAHNLLVSAGSDYHGPHSHHGTHPGMEMPDRLLKRFLQAVQPEKQAGGAAVHSAAG